MDRLEELEDQFVRIAQEIYERGERRIKPTWPWLLIRVVPKEQKYGSLHLPDGDGSARQNKPLLEGIVLEVWSPHWSLYIRPGKETPDKIWRESEYKPGERLLYPHFAGLPVNFLDESKYRLVREWTFDEAGGVLGHVHYDGDERLKEDVDRIFRDVHSVTLSGR